jgi:hypothetical protein
MRLYRARIPEIAHGVIDALCNENDIEVEPENREEAEQDLVAIMDTFLRRDMELREAVKDRMARLNTPYDQYGKVRSLIADDWGHPTGDRVEKFLSRQVIENFMISRFVEEVYTEDRLLFRKTLGIIRSFDVDERALREEAQSKVLNVREGTVEYEIALAEALREVKRRHGLIIARPHRD